MAEKNIELDSVEVAAAVFGNCDRNIRLLENEFSVTAVCRGTQLQTIQVNCFFIPPTPPVRPFPAAWQQRP